MTRNLLLFVSVFLLSYGCATVTVQKPKIPYSPAVQMDYSKLNLHISKTYTVPQIDSGDSYRLTPKDGSQLVVVELQGTAPSAMDIILEGKDFTAQSGADKFMASAVGVGEDKIFWGISAAREQGGSMNSKMRWSQKAGPFSFAIGFSMKREIKKFNLICGDTIIEAEILK